MEKISRLPASKAVIFWSIKNEPDIHGLIMFVGFIFTLNLDLRSKNKKGAPNWHPQGPWKTPENFLICSRLLHVGSFAWCMSSHVQGHTKTTIQHHDVPYNAQQFHVGFQKGQCYFAGDFAVHYFGAERTFVMRCWTTSRAVYMWVRCACM